MTHYEMSFQDYWRIILKRKVIIFFTFLAVFGISIFYTFTQTPVYKATATLRISTDLNIQKMPWIPSNKESINTDIKMINSTLFLEMLARRMSLISDETADEQKIGIIKSLQLKVQAEQVPGTGLINLSAISSNPAEASALANKLADVYIAKGNDDRRQNTKDLKVFIQKQLTEAKESLDRSEEEIKKFYIANKVSGLSQQLINRLIQLQDQRSLLLDKYTDKHPDVRKIDKQIEELETRISRLPAEDLAYTRKARDMKINEDAYIMIYKKYKEAQISDVDQINWATVITPAETPLKPVKPNKTANLTVGALLGLFMGFLFALMVQNVDSSIGSIEDMEKYLGLPVLGVIPRTKPEISSHFLPGKTSGKKVRIDPKKAKLIIYHSEQSPFIESFHTLRTNLKYVPGNGDQKIVAFTSAGISEGKSLVAANFALACAQGGLKTLLVELDLRRPTIHKIFGLDPEPGFTNYIVEKKKLDEVCRGTVDFLMGDFFLDKTRYPQWIENFKLITSGKIPHNPNSIFSSSLMGEVFSEMKAQYDMVVLDCSPVLLFADTLQIGNIISGAIIVYKSGQIAREAIKRTKDQLINDKVNVLGVVLNDITPSDVDPGYSYKAYKYYSKK